MQGRLVGCECEGTKDGLGLKQASLDKDLGSEE